VAGRLNTISGRMMLVLLSIHAVLLPAGFFGVLLTVRTGQQEAFIDHARIYARIFADIFEDQQSPQTETEIVRYLDSAVLGGRAVFAVIRLDDAVLSSSLMSPEEAELFHEDFEFGEHGDDVYYLSVPLEINGRDAVLQLGLDETPTLQQIDSVRGTLINLMLLYFFGTLLLATLFSEVLARPLKRLQRDSREIADGDYSRQLTVATRIQEIQDLGRDLETMRSNIVGVNAKLKQEIAEREAAEAEQRQLEARLRHAQRLESIGTLAGGVAHEFNNVLLPLLLYTDLALEDLPPDSPARPYLNRVVSLANRAKGLSEKILTFGRDRGESHRLAIDIGPVVEEAMSMVRALIPATIDIRTDIDGDAGAVLCDAAEIQQLIVNLCSNAFLALQSGGGHITVALDQCDVSEEFARNYARLQAGPHVRLKVTDTGEGMDAATVERIFEPFFTTREVGKGTGLGMSVVHGIVTKHGGEIIVSSVPKLGTTIAVYFPIVATDVPHAEEGRQQ